MDRRLCFKRHVASFYFLDILGLFAPDKMLDFSLQVRQDLSFGWRQASGSLPSSSWSQPRGSNHAVVWMETSMSPTSTPKPDPGVMGWVVFSQNPCVEVWPAVSQNETVYRYRAIKEGILAKWSHRGGPKSNPTSVFRRGNGHRHAQREGHLEAWKKMAICKQRRMGPKKKPPLQTSWSWTFSLPNR